MNEQPATPLPGSEAELLAAFQSAAADLQVLQADLQETLDEMNSRPLLTDDERKALEDQASSGELGSQMKELVGKIKDGEDTWEAVFAGLSPNASLFQGHLTALVEEHKDDLALAFEDLLDEEEAKGNPLVDEVGRDFSTE
ncbi:MAG: hypothetical protein ACI379_02295 [Nocardioides sp.]|uniref:hypothetical protein n=1 Tax=Nocardioides sp. TaxID=35761 RepID=UPI003F01914A